MDNDTQLRYKLAEQLSAVIGGLEAIRDTLCLDDESFAYTASLRQARDQPDN